MDGMDNMDNVFNNLAASSLRRHVFPGTPVPLYFPTCSHHFP